MAPPTPPRPTPEAGRPAATGSALARLGRGLALASSLGVTFSALVSFGALAGLLADRKLGTGPWLLLAGLLLGIVSAFYSMYRVVALFQRLEARDEAAPGDETGDRSAR